MKAKIAERLRVAYKLVQHTFYFALLVLLIGLVHLDSNGGELNPFTHRALFWSGMLGWLSMLTGTAHYLVDRSARRDAAKARRQREYDHAEALITDKTMTLLESARASVLAEAKRRKNADNGNAGPALRRDR